MSVPITAESKQFLIHSKTDAVDAATHWEAEENRLIQEAEAAKVRKEEAQDRAADLQRIIDLLNTPS